MGKRVGIEVSLAIAEAAGMCNPDVVAAYPITPQTHVVEHLSELVADGHLDAEFIPVESEHSAMSACVGAAAAGARTVTSTSSQGYALMAEICYIAAALRLPIVMVVANRALSAPINIWNDLGDLMMARDTGWIQIVAENGQEAVDLTIQAFRIGEDPRIQFPVQVNFDGFTLSHMVEPIFIPEKAEVDAFLPPYRTKHRLDPANPMTMGPVGMPDIYTEARKAQDEAFNKTLPVIKEIWSDFAAKFGREYKAVETYKADDAETIIVMLGSLSETAMTAVDDLRAKGKKVGLARFRVFRPFPADDLLAAIKGAKNLVVVDRAMSFNGGNLAAPIGLEVKSLLFDKGLAPKFYNVVAGLGGRDITMENFEEMVDKVATAKNGDLPAYEIINVRE